MLKSREIEFNISMKNKNKKIVTEEILQPKWGKLKSIQLVCEVFTVNKRSIKSPMHTALVTPRCLMVSLEHLMFKTHNIQSKANQPLIINLLLD